MKTITKKYKVYRFDELSEDAKDKAIEHFSDTNVDYEWWDSIYEDAKQVGFKIDSFDCDRYCKGNFIESAEETAHAIMEEHGESCETYKTAADYLKSRDEIIESAVRDENGDFEDEYKLDCNLDDLDTEFKNSLLEDYRIMLRHEYEYLTSRESIIETIDANDYEFTEDGKVFHG